jgi:hypothetical protein
MPGLDARRQEIYFEVGVDPAQFVRRGDCPKAAVSLEDFCHLRHVTRMIGPQIHDTA